MKFKLFIKQEGKKDSEAFCETYEKNVTDVEKYGREIVDYFNSTLKPYEKPRVYVGYEIIDEDKGIFSEHDWEKTNGATLETKAGIHDAYICRKCGITGKRFTLNGSVKIDSKFKAEVYERCDTSYIFRKRKGYINE